MCENIYTIKSENTHDTEKINLNIAATTGIVASGIGYSQFEELCSAIDVPVFTPNTYTKYQDQVLKKWEQTASSSMAAAAEKEKEMAIEEGQTKGGFPVIDVLVDGSWINAIVSSIAAKSRSLIEDVDTNNVECFNSVIAKFIGGKRINFALKGGYQGRCSAAVVSFNTKSAISTVQSAFTGKCPGGNAVIVERKRSQKRKINFEHPKKKRRILKEINKKQHDYGPASAAPDMSPQQLEKAKEEFMKNLKDVTCDRNAIERATVLQRDSSEWLELRKNLVTASNFGPICAGATCQRYIISDFCEINCYIGDRSFRWNRKSLNRERHLLTRSPHNKVP
ncbi:unnamed protein product [Parnassius apollo]|uniref:(apollo) hypothetical protein n=1 Tax=Parnassius apollo TaxID=110799 RepID=A0A8S3Y2V2_PARAO|nr:unnamed protein product [Parnassius apollo]